MTGTHTTFIMHCVENIIKNTFGHSENGDEISIKVKSDKDKIIYAIIDEGVGFSDLALENLFNLLSPDKEYVDNEKGLGLAISKLIMGIHGGKIEIDNNSKKGATVKLIFNSSY